MTMSIGVFTDSRGKGLGPELHRHNNTHHMYVYPFPGATFDSIIPTIQEFNSRDRFDAIYAMIGNNDTTNIKTLSMYNELPYRDPKQWIVNMSINMINSELPYQNTWKGWSTPLIHEVTYRAEGCGGHCYYFNRLVDGVHPVPATTTKWSRKLRHALWLNGHFTDDTEWMLNPNIFELACQKWGRPHVDLFASRNNKQINKHVSWCPDPHALFTDAFSENWHDLNFVYVFPPFRLLTRVLQKIRKEKVKAILVAPNWSGQPWFPTLQNLSSNCLLIPRK